MRDVSSWTRPDGAGSRWPTWRAWILVMADMVEGGMAEEEWRTDGELLLRECGRLQGSHADYLH